MQPTAHSPADDLEQLLTTTARRLRGALRRVLVRPSGVRRHLAPGLSLDEFFARLDERGVSYVVLRWFDSLPQVAPGEDVDLLVADDDLAVVHSLMASRPTLRRTQPFDVYSVSGLPGSDFRGVPYYPPRFAAGLLDRSVRLRGRYQVPSPQDHFDSLAYHAVYHKGRASGLAATTPRVTPTSAGSSSGAVPEPTDHDYEGVLAELARATGLLVQPTLEGLDDHLAGQGLRPPLDTLERLAEGNPWIRDRFLADRGPLDDVWRGLAVFVLRERAEGQVADAVLELDRQGFEVLEVVRLDQAQRERAGHRLRGGNWGRGPWPLSGGGPSVFVLAYDFSPDVRGPEGPGADNHRIPVAKEHVRARLLRGVATTELYNPLHSSDNPGQALDYLEALGDPSVRCRVRAAAQALVDSTVFPYPVVRPLPGEARRARVAVVDHPVYGPSVCKVFRPGASRFFDRELMARKDLADLPEVPGLIECGVNWLISPLYSDDGSHLLRTLPGTRESQLTPKASRELAGFAVALHQRGLFLLDVSTRNLMCDPVAGLKFIDLEFLQEYTEPVGGPESSYTFWGVPPGATGYDEPMIGDHGRRRGPSGPSSRRNAAFHAAVTGLTVADLLAPPTTRSSLQRALVQGAWYSLLVQRARLTAVRSSVGATWWGRDLRTIGGVVSRRAWRR